MDESELVGWMDGRYLPVDQIKLPISDLGVMQAANVVDRLRSCNGSVLDAEPHLRRFARNCQKTLGLTVSISQVETALHKCLQQSLGRSPSPDLSIVLMATPGAPTAARPTLIVYATELPWRRLFCWHTVGQPTFVSQTCAIPRDCWSPAIKTRSRLNYYLAQQESPYDPQQFAEPILPTIDGILTESASANVILVEDGGLVCPPKDLILGGVSLQRTIRLAESVGITVRHQAFDTARAAAAEAILMTGTAGGVWPVERIGDHVFRQPQNNSTLRQMRQLWSEDIGFCIHSQAIQVGNANGFSKYQGP